MKKITIIARIIMGSIFTLFSLMYFLHMMPAQELQGPAGTFMTGLFSSGYMLNIVKAVELICGIALITGQFSALANVIIFPITLNIFLFHAFLMPGTVAMSVALLLLNLFLAYSYKEKYMLILARK
jgi:putative oxidoreductase